MSRTTKDSTRATEQVQLLEKLHPSVRHLVHHITQPGVIETLEGRISILEVSSSRAPSLVKHSHPTGDRVLLRVPYGGHAVLWQILFNSRLPREAPDIICRDPAFVPNLAKASDKLQLLRTWDADTPESLVKLIKIMLELYAEFQVAQTQQGSVLYELYKSLLSLGTSPPDIEILVTPNSHKLRWNLKLSLPHLPLLENWSCEQNAASTHFTVTQERVTSAQLRLNPALEERLTAEDQSKLPRLSSFVHVAGYVKSLKSHLQNICDRITANFELRRKLVAALSTTFARAVIDVDRDTYQRVVMYVRHELLPVIVHVDLSEETGHSIQPVVSLYVPSHQVTFSGKTEMFSTEYESDKFSSTISVHAFCKSFHSGLLKNLTRLKSS